MRACRPRSEALDDRRREGRERSAEQAGGEDEGRRKGSGEREDGADVPLAKRAPELPSEIPEARARRAARCPDSLPRRTGMCCSAWLSLPFRVCLAPLATRQAVGARTRVRL